MAATTLGLLPLSLPAAPPPGQLLASQCAQCHGTNGQAVSGFESIRGKSAEDMFKTLVEMKNRPVESIMDRQARGYTDAQLRLIAEYLAKLPATNR
jgi:sulfide dehydrogenase cytochrome subunit